VLLGLSAAAELLTVLDDNVRMLLSDCCPDVSALRCRFASLCVLYPILHLVGGGGVGLDAAAAIAA
jgi:hypothetical protein